jgi:hypothetical protein
MMKSVIFLAILFMTSVFACNEFKLRRKCNRNLCHWNNKKCQKYKSVTLLIGNSLLSQRDTPMNLQRLLGKNHKVVNLCENRFTINIHSRRKDLTRYLINENVDNVVYQAQSKELSYGYRYSYLYINKQLKSMVDKTKYGRSFLIQTQGYIHGAYSSDSFNAMTTRIRKQANYVAKYSNIDVIPFGDELQEIYNNSSNPRYLFFHDGFHLSPGGAKLLVESIYNNIKN